MYKYKNLRKKVLEESGEDIGYIVNTLVAYLYTVRKTSAKKGLWDSFGDIILGNLKRNLEGKGSICQLCGKRFVQKRATQNYCSTDCYDKAKNQREIERFCHKKQ